jgi:DNA-binding response OmpR family regulator
MALDISEVSFLIVEDNLHMRTIIKTILSAFGVRKIEMVPDGAEALKSLKIITPDIILLDWWMTPIDGIEFTRMIRSGNTAASPFTPIIMISGYGEVGRVVEARDTGVNEFLIKPISAKGLFARIRSVIQNPRPFVRTKTYYGPDRRRAQKPFQGADKRKNTNTN